MTDLIERVDDVFTDEAEAKPAGGDAPPRRSALSRRLPWALVVVALAVGFGVGQASGGGCTTKVASTPTPLVSPQQVSAALSGNGLGLSTVNDRGFSQLENGIQHNHGFPLALTPADQALLAHQMVIAQQTVMRYPTLADAYAAGLHRAGPFSPGLGLHMIAPANFTYASTASVMTDAQIEHPLAWIYGGTHPNSPVVGLFYMSFTPSPGGFAGPNDVWHIHKNICLRGSDAPLGADGNVTQAQCAAVGGNLLKITPYLLHVWTVPGFEDAQGVFAHLNPAITCNDGTYHVVPSSQIGSRLTMCVDGTE